MAAGPGATSSPWSSWRRRTSASTAPSSRRDDEFLARGEERYSGVLVMARRRVASPGWPSPARGWRSPRSSQRLVDLHLADAETDSPRPRGWVPCTYFWMADERPDTFLGSIALRHSLDTRCWLEVGGHIGYSRAPERPRPWARHRRPAARSCPSPPPWAWTACWSPATSTTWPRPGPSRPAAGCTKGTLRGKRRYWMPPTRDAYGDPMTTHGRALVVPRNGGSSVLDGPGPRGARPRPRRGAGRGGGGRGQLHRRLPARGRLPDRDAVRRRAPRAPAPSTAVGAGVDGLRGRRPGRLGRRASAAPAPSSTARPADARAGARRASTSTWPRRRCSRA